MWHDATVRWFDNLRGEGFVRIGERSFFVHWSAVARGTADSLPDAFRSPKTTWAVLFKGQRVQVQILDDEYAKHVTRLRQGEL